ncbi:MAG: pyruvate dehydrogenase (acetyl-transferring), homodimeric type [Proteobacteria bacterium]|nr:pyruvate dehydrogenase (acetyl-transferring), homodimeric type [Pseudomonadota bacterium]
MSALPEFPSAANDPDTLETKEWLDALETVLEREGADRAHYLLEKLIEKARRSGAYLPYNAQTAYLNTIPPHLEQRSPGDHTLEERIRSFARWNAMVMVAKANQVEGDLGGHIASFASVGTLFGIGFNHFWNAPHEGHGGDLIYFQGHSAPGVYARAYMEGRLTEKQITNFRRDVEGEGVTSYPHPWLMPDFWQFPTVSMGLGPLQAIYQARYLKYLHARGFADTANRKVWAFLGDGETDEPESLGAIGMAAREKLDNLVFVVNCNLQRLDGPVRGNGKIIQELEGTFRGAGWNVIKLIWGSYWDPLLARDKDGALLKIMEETVDGEYQNYKANDGAFVRKHFFGKNPKTAEMVSRMSDEDIWRLNRGGHDPHKIYAAYAAATQHKGQPTVILAKTVKGYGMGKIGEGKNTTHQQKKMDMESIRHFRDRFNIPVPDDKLEELPFFKPADDSPEMIYLQERRKALGGYLPQRRRKADVVPQVPELAAFDQVLKATDREISTTMAFVRILTALVRDKNIGKHIVPIVPDEARTFGMEGMFRQLGIFSIEGQKYEPVDKDQVMYYREDKAGQILEEGINEAGAFSSWIAAATSYSTTNVVTVPFYIFYSMFGMQRIGDLAWAAGDQRARGFLLGGTAGRTTLNGEGLQHEDGHSHVMSSVIPNCISYDPTFGYELAVIIHDGLRRMVTNQEDVFYYITVMNENYTHPALPEAPGTAADILKGMYLFKAAGKKKHKVQLMGSGTILREVIAAAELLEKDWDVASDIWSCPSFTELRREGHEVERWNLLHPTDPVKKSHVEQCLEKHDGPVIASTDYMKAFADQIRPFMPKGRGFRVLGTDGFGRSDTRDMLRQHFEVNRHWVVLAALKSLADEGAIKPAVVADAIKKYGIDPAKPNPVLV